MTERSDHDPTLRAAETPDSRARLERFVARRYARAYGADLDSCLPLLFALEDAGGALIGVIGAARGADTPRFFLERYLAAPVERLLSARAATDVPRSSIAEVGNLAATGPGAGNRLMLGLAERLAAEGIAWSVFTATTALRNGLTRFGVRLTDLGAADGVSLGAERSRWGTYFETRPRVSAVNNANLLESARREAFALRPSNRGAA